MIDPGAEKKMLGKNSPVLGDIRSFSGVVYAEEKTQRRKKGWICLFGIWFKSTNG